MHKLIWIAVFTFILSACDESSFSSGGDDKKSAGPVQEALPRAHGEYPGLPAPIGSACQKSEEAKYNLALVFDASGSMENADPGMVRAQGAKALMTKLVQQRTQQPQITFDVGLVSFAKTAQTSHFGWIPLNSQNTQIIHQQIDQLTRGGFFSHSHGSMGTVYTAGLIAANDLLQRKHAANNGRDRNFVIFLTDGAPHDSESAIQAEISKLTNNLNTVITAVAVGTSIKRRGQEVVQRMAQPKTPMGSDPRHVGSYHYAQQAQQLESIFDQIFQNTFSCP